jgi:hypothetical protein
VAGSDEELTATGCFAASSAALVSRIRVTILR